MTDDTLSLSHNFLMSPFFANFSLSFGFGEQTFFFNIGVDFHQVRRQNAPNRVLDFKKLSGGNISGSPSTKGFDLPSNSRRMKGGAMNKGRKR